MSDEPTGAPAPGGPGGEPELSAEQEETLRRMEEEMRRVRVQDLIAQSVVSILNLSYRRIAKQDEQDLVQAQAGIDAVAALVDHLEPEARGEVMNALSQVRMAYAQAAGGGAGSEAAGGEHGSGAEPGGAGSSRGAPSEAPGGAGPAQDGPRKPPPGLWVPGSD